MTLHPPGRHFLDARVKVERRPHADLQRLDGVPVLVGEQILLRTAQTHEHKPDATPVDSIHDARVRPGLLPDFVQLQPVLDAAARALRDRSNRRGCTRPHSGSCRDYHLYPSALMQGEGVAGA